MTNLTVLNFGHWFLFEFCILMLEFLINHIKLVAYKNPGVYLLKCRGLGVDAAKIDNLLHHFYITLLLCPKTVNFSVRD